MIELDFGKETRHRGIRSAFGIAMGIATWFVLQTGFIPVIGIKYRAAPSSAISTAPSAQRDMDFFLFPRYAMFTPMLIRPLLPRAPPSAPSAP